MLAKLFEDPDERENRIKSSIARSRQQKKRLRLNSGTSNQSKVRSSQATGGGGGPLVSESGSNGKYLSSRNNGQVMNSDLLKHFQEDIERMQVSLENIQVVLRNPNI